MLVAVFRLPVLYASFIDKKLLAINVGNFVQEVLNRSQRPDLSHADIVEEINLIHQTLTDRWLICYGKDMTEVLSIGLQNALGTKKAQEVKPDMIRKDLRLAFHRDDMNMSRLGQDLADWEARNPEYEVLSRV